MVICTIEGEKMPIWDTPYYELKALNGDNVTIDVTMSVNTSLRANKAINQIIYFLKYFFKDEEDKKSKKHKTDKKSKKKNKGEKIVRIVDFGAGALRHTLPLLKAGLEVCAVDFEEEFVGSNSKGKCVKKIRVAKRYKNFNGLISPRDFLEDKRVFDAALVCYTFQGMPIKKEREYALKLIYEKMETPSFLIWMSRYGDAQDLPEAHCVTDGFYKYPRSKRHSFYREFRNEEIRKMLENVRSGEDFYQIKSLGEGGRDQILVFCKNDPDQGEIKWPPPEVRKKWRKSWI